MSGAQWLELLCRHSPDRFEHLVRYVGWYSNRCRARRAAVKDAGVAQDAAGDEGALAARASSAWARLIHKVYEVDPLECPKCKGHVIALIDDAEVIERILKHLGIWVPPRNAPQEERPPPRSERGGEATRAANVLTYHPVPDIA